MSTDDSDLMPKSQITWETPVKGRAEKVWNKTYYMRQNARQVDQLVVDVVAVLFLISITIKLSLPVQTLFAGWNKVKELKPLIKGKAFR